MATWKKLATLGSGSYATVYLSALNLPDGSNRKIVAVKSSSHFSYSVASLKKEKKILELFKGCNEIIQCYFDQYAIEKYYVSYNLFMELAPYGSLGELIRKRGALSEDTVRIYTHMLLKGLHCIHGKEVVHCDLKPDNILLFPTWTSETWYQVKIADFGLAKTREEAKAEFGPGKMKFRGAAFYMSPESVTGVIGTALDIWSLGCIVIEMITGMDAWRNVKSQEELMVKLALHKEAPPIPDGLSWVCKDFLSKCFVKDPTQRSTSAMLLNHPFINSAYNSDMQTSHTAYQIYSQSVTSSSLFSYDLFDYLPRN
ncbi:mitogen-activated protein kinase kinase kinase 17 [Cajanus cajan]|uniref:Mitogen-activated protein kinase kinase kinase A n=1 Tax=Cajanus cajan TaxID=3821 RepID=A0A151TN81_CAJCA|nr:mitogen-activated protein kinase kinase kinase 17 [Cajanus cajan]KYP68503.1 Mitogen-activated protein kinase kinase kinase A [Cajanus cajan]